MRTENRTNGVKGEDNTFVLHNIVLIDYIIEFLDVVSPVKFKKDMDSIRFMYMKMRILLIPRF